MFTCLMTDWLTDWLTNLVVLTYLLSDWVTDLLTYLLTYCQTEPRSCVKVEGPSWAPRTFVFARFSLKAGLFTVFENVIVI